MKNLNFILLAAFISASISSCAQEIPYDNEDFKIKTTKVTHQSDIGILIWEINVQGLAGNTTPTPNGELDGAPVLGYVFPTSLKPTDVGFSQTEGILALALTSHPDFDDTPLWDENNDSVLDNDGIIWHPHWVVLTKDDRVPGGLAVKQFNQEDSSVKLPATNPGMPMYMDSPGFPVTTSKNLIRVVVPLYRVNNQSNFNFDGVAAHMIVNTSKEGLPMLGVYNVYSVASGDLSLPYSVQTK